MKILAIRGQNLASLPGFDLELASGALEGAGLFAIVGPTGSGKSTILDAMCLALYQKAPRLDDAPSDTRMAVAGFGQLAQDDIRQLLRRGTSTGSAEVDFKAVDGESYRVRWAFRAPKRKGASVQEEMSLVRLSDGAVLRTSADRKDVFRAHVDSLVGMTWPQFTRTILLAQGRFAEFLRAGENERSALLERLTGTGIFTKISMEIYRRTRLECDELDFLRHAREGLAILPPEQREAIEAECSTLHLALSHAHARAKDASDLLETCRRLEALGKDDVRIRQELDSGRTILATEESNLEEKRDQLAMARQRDLLLAPEIDRARTLDHELEAAREALDESRRRLDSVHADREDLAQRVAAIANQRHAMSARIAVVDGWLAQTSRLAPIAQEWSTVDRLLNQLEAENEKLRRSDQELDRARLELVRSAEELSQAETELAILQNALTAEKAPVLQARIASSESESASLERLRERTRLGDELAELRVVLESSEGMLAQIHQRLPALETAERTAHAMLEVARIASSKDVHTLRSILRDGDPCPVCGSMDHPWRDEESSTGPILSAQEEFHQRAREDLESARHEIIRLETSIQSSRSRIDRLVVQEGFLGGSEDMQRAELEAAVKANPQLSKLDWIVRRLEETLERRRSDQAALERLHQYAHASSRVALKSQTRQHKRKETDALEIRRSEETDHLEGIASDLDAYFGGRAWREYHANDPDYRRKLSDKVTEYVRLRDERSTLARELEVLDGSERTLSEEQPRLEKTRAAALDELERAQTLWQERADERTRILSGRPWREVQAESLERLATLSREAESAESACVGIREGLARSMGALERIATDLDEIRQTSSGLAKRLGIALDGEFDPAKLASETLSAWRTQESRRAQLQALIAQDDRALAQGRELEDKIRSREQIAGRWSVLAREVGSADGKAFRRIAQQLTLENLLERANLELEGLSPRYRLRAVPDSLHFGVEDRESFEEIRPVHTLSGGETFLVSLALALALSSIASGNQAVETLFIDEGFGTLDGAVLTEVVQALERLHATGRQIGIVTHVEELKDQVAARVEVRRTGPGRSAVFVTS